MSAVTKAGVLGRIDRHCEADSERLLSVLGRLDALLALISNHDIDKDNNVNDFQAMNHEIQRMVLDLAADLAWEAHTLHWDALSVRDGLAQRPQRVEE